jgi:uncharacterized coiled-coil DUF342 family protein
MKIKKQIDFANPTAKTYCQLVSLIQEYGKINELNVKLTNLKTTNQALKAEINMLNDKLSTIQNKYNSNETKVATLSNELNIKAKELNDITKLHKNEIKTLMEEVKRIKETWTPHEKKMEYITTIDELEKQIKDFVIAEEYKIYLDRLIQGFGRILCSQEIVHAKNENIKYSLLKELVDPSSK